MHDVAESSRRRWPRMECGEDDKSCGVRIYCLVGSSKSSTGNGGTA